MVQFETVLDIAQQAGQAILDIYQHPETINAEVKADHSPITAADRAAHQIICQQLSQHWPDIPVLSEESDPDSIADRQQWRRYWLVDPLDGTKEFIKRNGDFTVNIALIDKHQPVLGVVHIPVTGESYVGLNSVGLNSDSQRQALKFEPGQTTGRQIHTRPLVPDNIQVLVSRSHPDPRLPHILQQLEQFGSIQTHSRGSSLKFCLIAEGLADVHLRLGPTSEWDTAAAHAVLEAAGGRVITPTRYSLVYNLNATLINPDFMAVGDTNQAWHHINLS